MPRTIHLKAYVVDGQDAMMGSANMTRRGMRSNIESMIPVTLSEHPSLSDAVQSSVEGSLEVDEAVCRRFKERVESFPPLETPKFPKFDPIHGETETQILELMPDMPTISQLIESAKHQRRLGYTRNTLWQD